MISLLESVKLAGGRISHRARQSNNPGEGSFLFLHTSRARRQGEAGPPGRKLLQNFSQNSASKQKEVVRRVRGLRLRENLQVGSVDTLEAYAILSFGTRELYIFQGWAIPSGRSLKDPLAVLFQSLQPLLRYCGI